MLGDSLRASDPHPLTSTEISTFLYANSNPYLLHFTADSTLEVFLKNYKSIQWLSESEIRPEQKEEQGSERWLAMNL